MLILIVLIASLDAFAISFAYAANKTVIPLKHIFIINTIGSMILSVSFFLGFFITVPALVQSFLLIALGIYKIYESRKKAEVHNQISFKMAIFLALALSIDNALLGISLEASPIAIFLLSFTIGPIFMYIGQILGGKLAKIDLNLSWLGGLLLIILAFI
ncbi:MAG: manganese efflux pump [Defluviitaleaceae bacterium]|nr:manganese efflux pump [Defluviitaleaceae bacterium]